MRRAHTAAAAALIVGGGCLGGCFLPPLGAAAAGGTFGAAVATYVADAKTVKVAADDIAAANKPIVQAICYIEPWKPHSAAAQADIKQFCANVPSDALGAFKGAVLLLKALRAEDRAHDALVSPAAAP